MKPITAKTCTQAWLKAATHLENDCSENREYTLILEIENPLALPKEDKEIFVELDKFLTENGGYSINTVTNTIFPASLYQRYGADELFKRYRELAPRVKDHPDCKWGTYAMRLAGEREGKNGETFSPIEAIIEKLESQLGNSGPKRAAYELNLIDPVVDIPIYDCTSDRKYLQGGPCLSHLSFKLRADRKLLLTAFYRSHYYVQRALGNLCGLAWLQHFVATKLGIETAELVCISSMAYLDKEGWGKRKLAKLLQRCREISDTRDEAAVVAAEEVAAT